MKWHSKLNTLSSVSIALVVALATGAFKAYAQSALPADTAQTLEVIRKQYNLPALAVVIAKDGKICERAAVGVRKLGDPTLVATNDQFHIGSCTKSMTATLAAMLIEEGKLHWDTTIADVFPELKGKIDKQFETVTVEQLLNHRAGVCREPPAAAWMQACEQKGTPTQQRYEFIKAALAQPPDAKPGTKFIYSNQGYATVGAILERIAGQPLESLITDKLFKPLHMDSAGFGPPGTTGQVDQPWGHTRSLGGIQPCQKDNPPAIAPAGTVHCSLDDLGHYTIFHMEGEQKDGLLNAETIRKLHTPPEGGDYTCGWLVVKRFWAGGPAIMHDGSNGMWYIVMWLAPEKDFSVVIATNISGPDAAKACDEVVRTMIRKWLAYLDKPIELK
jgi:CubicO group peptidase (beta-lactamase class C family)